MKRLTLACLLMFACVALPACAHTESLVQMQVVDQDTGGLLRHYPHRGNDYIEGQPGHRFSLSLQNLTGERVLAVVSVDGVNVVSGQTAGTGQAGYVLDPWQSIQVSGWRKSYADIAEFYFTDLPDSYAARTGRPGNVGVIGVAAFRERRQPPPDRAWPQIGRAESPAAPAAKAADAMTGSDSGMLAERRDHDLAAQELGTGHGQRRYDPVAQTQFERESPRPNQTLSLFYDSYQALAARGIVPTPGRTGQPDPFPISFVPDPD